MRPKPRITKYIGLSTDTKPSADYGDTFLEMDTGTVCMFDGETWHARSREREYSGDIVSFKARKVVPMQSVVVSMEPVQDLHGYDHPWPAGGGENLANKASGMHSGGVTATVAEDGTITLNGTATTVTYVVGDFDCKDATATYTWATFNTQAYTDGVEFSVRNADITPAGGWARVNAVNKTFTFTPDTGSAPTKWRIQINAGTTFNQAQFKPMIVKGSTAPTSYAPYENLCPISGRTGAEVTRDGKNLADTVNALKGYISNNTGDFHASYTSACSNFINIKPDTDYTFTTAQTGGRYGAWYNANKECIAGFVGTSTVFTKHSPANAKYVMYTYSYENGNPSYVDNVMIELGSAATAYEPYQGETISVSWESEAGTVYGGTLDVVSGELVVDRAMVDLGTLNWGYSGTNENQYFYAAVANKATGYNNFICSIYKTSAQPGVANLEDKSIVGENSGRSVLVKDSAYTDAATFKAAVTGQTLVYELATPITYHLTPQEVRTLLGQNNVWSDAGDVTVKVKL